MENYKAHTEEINGDFTALYFSLYMQGEWGIQVGYQTLPVWYVNMRKKLADWQNDSDCCALCTESKKPQNAIILSYAGYPTNVNHCPPFAPLYSGSCHYYDGDSITNKPCTYKGIGDFNNDFNTDFFR